VALAITLGGVGACIGAASAGGEVSAPQVVVFTFTGGPQQFVVPPGVTSIDVTVEGGQGGHGSTCVGVNAGECGTGGDNGGGTLITAHLPVTPGDTLTIIVGGAGGDATDYADNGAVPAEGGAGGFGHGTGGAGSDGGIAAAAGGGGGGSSAITAGATPILVAPGGGGGGGGGGRLMGPINPPPGSRVPTPQDGGAGGNGSVAGADGEPPCQGHGGEAATETAAGSGGQSVASECYGPFPAAGDRGADGDGPAGGSGGGGGVTISATGPSIPAIGAGGGGGGGGLFGGGGGSGGSAQAEATATTFDQTDGPGGGGGGGSALAPQGATVEAATVVGTRARSGRVVIVIPGVAVVAEPSFTG
jgi:hypothetical protein